ncbi:hypothetical protein BC938DRAFT_473751 [Jimgerdemannia flammicorona]|uniref:Uncharacterized protein n=1 Tax=Jimgerdemannia flammicorona TaxID=994334 RepID=A0A433Q3M4_9FUNG|nr:hypothetical protein BC938DRAFT_473751 [Jimgerdemannia flammicorona]
MGDETGDGRRDGQWETGDGRWVMGDGRWEMGISSLITRLISHHSSRLPSLVSHCLSSIARLPSPISHHLSPIACLVSHRSSSIAHLPSPIPIAHLPSPGSHHPFR